MGQEYRIRIINYFRRYRVVYITMYRDLSEDEIAYVISLLKQQMRSDGVPSPSSEYLISKLQKKERTNRKLEHTSCTLFEDQVKIAGLSGNSSKYYRDAIDFYEENRGRVK